MKRVFIEKDNGELEDITKLPPNEYYEFLNMMQKIIFAQAILNTINDGKN